MNSEFKKKGLDVAFASINRLDAVDNQADLVERCTFPLLQDSAELGIFDLMDAAKDDIYVYDDDGALAVHLPLGGTINTDLGHKEGYGNLKGIAMALAAPE